MYSPAAASAATSASRAIGHQPIPAAPGPLRRNAARGPFQHVSTARWPAGLGSAGSAGGRRAAGWPCRTLEQDGTLAAGGMVHGYQEQLATYNVNGSVVRSSNPANEAFQQLRQAVLTSLDFADNAEQTMDYEDGNDDLTEEILLDPGSSAAVALTVYEVGALGASRRWRLTLAYLVFILCSRCCARACLPGLRPACLGPTLPPLPFPPPLCHPADPEDRPAGQDAARVRAATRPHPCPQPPAPRPAAGGPFPGPHQDLSQCDDQGGVCAGQRWGRAGHHHGGSLPAVRARQRCLTQVPRGGGGDVCGSMG